METALHLLPNCPGLTLNSPYFDAPKQEVHLGIEINDIGSPCPRCQTDSHALHSHYVRQVRDLPWGEWTVHLSITAHKYRCRMPDCPQQVFCQRLPSVVAPWARRTLRLAEDQRQLGLALGGAAGARLAVKQRMSVSRSTLLRLVRSVPCPSFPTPRVLGIDDWAIRKRQRYATILVDLETRRSVALLADREAATLRVWLDAHPGIEIVTRDRYKAFADGVSGGAPQAQQVLDRFHLMQNLTAALEKVFSQSRTALETVLVPEGATPLPVAPLLAVHDLSHNPVMPLTAALLVPPGLPTIASKTRRQRRIERYEQIKAWHAQGWTISAIARQLGIDRRSVRRAIQADAFPEFTRRARKLDPYKAHLIQRWNEGCRTGPILFAELQALGYQGQRTAVAIYLQRLRQAQGLPKRLRNAHPDHPLQHVNVRDVHRVRLTPEEAAFSILKRAEDRTAKDEALIVRLYEASAGLRETVNLAQTFAALLRDRKADGLSAWLDRATGGAVPILARFARGLRAEGAALVAAFTSPWSNGQVEGQVNRLKALKRQMYGRAKLDLLERRFLAGP